MYYKLLLKMSGITNREVVQKTLLKSLLTATLFTTLNCSALESEYCYDRYDQTERSAWGFESYTELNDYSESFGVSGYRDGLLKLNIDATNLNPHQSALFLDAIKMGAQQVGNAYTSKKSALPYDSTDVYTCHKNQELAKQPFQYMIFVNRILEDRVVQTQLLFHKESKGTVRILAAIVKPTKSITAHGLSLEEIENALGLSSEVRSGRYIDEYSSGGRSSYKIIQPDSSVVEISIDFIGDYQNLYLRQVVIEYPGLPKKFILEKWEPPRW